MNSVSEERLERVALTDGYRQYTYRQMFRVWERYAEAFSGLGLTGENHSRVGIVSVTLSETIFALYGLNMTGASISLIYHLDLYNEKQIYSMIEREKITDLVISELFAFPNLMKRLIEDKEMLGIENIIVLPSPMGGDYAIPAFELVRKLNKDACSELSGCILMEDLLEKYEAYPISISKEASPIVLHTTGTVSGMHKPVPLSNKAMNSFVLSFMKAEETFEDFKHIPDHPVTCVPFYLSWAYFMVDSLHTSLSMGAEVICLPMASMNPRYSEAIETHKVNVIFTGMVFDTWNKTRPNIDLSELKFVIIGGTYISPEYKKEFNDYLKSCGSTARFINGYGLSELCGACAICPSSRNDDAIGYLLPGVKAKILVEEEKRYYDISDGPRTGVLLLAGPTMSDGKLDGTEFFELEDVDGEKYFNTHDLVRVDKDGCLTCIGRSNNYFVNNAGVRFDAGLVETAVTSQPGIKACGLAPEFHKVLHDNVPILYVEMSDKGSNELSVLRDALIQVFIKDELISDTNLPSQCVLVEHMPLNSNGKVDGKKLKTGAVKGDRYSIKPVLIKDKLIDVLLVPAPEGESATVDAGVPQELEDDPYNLLSAAFAAIPEVKEKGISAVLKIPGLRELVLKLTDFDIDNIPLSLWNLSPKLVAMVYNSDLRPLMKELKNMASNGRDQIQGFMPRFNGNMPFMPPMPPMMPPMLFPGFGSWQKPEVKKSDSDRAGELDPNMLTFWDQLIELQKSSIESSRDQWEDFTDQVKEMEDTFSESLPEEFPVLPGFPPLPFTPKEMMDYWQEFEEMSKEHFMDQADSFAVYYIKSQEQARDMMGNISDKVSDGKKGRVKGEGSKPKTKAASSKKKGTRIKTAKVRPADKE